MKSPRVTQVRVGLLLALVTIVTLGAVSQAQTDQRAEAREQVEFGIDMARRGLWEDATQRFERAVKLDPSYAEAWNDLGIGYEQLGKLEEARDAYDRALKLAPSNQFIRNNYQLFRQIYDRLGVRRRGGGVANGKARQVSPLSVLTVPADSLPDGCGLSPPGRWISLPVVPSNPWVGTDRTLKLQARNLIDGAPAWPDAPPLDRRERASYLSKWTTDVVEAYRAQYVTEYGDRIGVLAVRFTNPELARRTPVTGMPRRGAWSLLVNGATVIRVSSNTDGECYRAIKDYLKSVK